MGVAVKPLSKQARKPLQNRRTHKPKSPIDKATGYEVLWSQVSGLFDAARTFADPCFIYLIGEEDNGPIKIGHSKDPVARLRTMQTGNPWRLRIEYVLIGDLTLEKILHELWEPYAIRSSRNARKPKRAPGTEWFDAEVRDSLLPSIMLDATRRQIELLQADEPPTFETLHRAVRDAHAESGFVAAGRDEVRLLGRTVGYAISRPSRL